MPRRSRLRRFTKWSGLFACAAITALWMASYFWECTYEHTFWRKPFPEVSWMAACNWGQVLLVRMDWHKLPGGSYGAPPPGLTIRRFSPGCVFWVRPWPYGLGPPACRRAPGWLDVVVPLWLLLAGLATPTCWLWWRDRRRIPPGHCQTCGYDLTGNVSGRCPECGTACGEQSTTPT